MLQVIVLILLHPEPTTSEIRYQLQLSLYNGNFYCIADEANSTMHSRSAVECLSKSHQIHDDLLKGVNFMSLSGNCMCFMNHSLARERNECVVYLAHGWFHFDL